LDVARMTKLRSRRGGALVRPDKQHESAPESADPFRGIRGSLRLPALVCNHGGGGGGGKGCRGVTFGADQLPDGVLPAGFLPFQRNYRFSCAKCSGSGAPTCFPIKAMKFEAIVDAFLNLTWETHRHEFKVAEVKAYLLEHWDMLLCGWERRPPEKFDIAPCEPHEPRLCQCFAAVAAWCLGCGLCR
jgi:hypothetical protein